MAGRSGIAVRMNPLFLTLHLSHGLGWHMAASAPAGSLLTGLASILQSGEHRAPGGLPWLLFIERTDSPGTGAPENLPQAIMLKDSLPGDGWRPSPMGTLRTWDHEGSRDRIIEVPPALYDLTTLISAMSHVMVYISREAMKEGGLPFHGALVEKEGRGIILAGPGGAGKSTCCARLPSSWRALCDDAVLVIPGSSEGYLAHPMPTWSDLWIRKLKKSWKAEEALPLSLVLFIEQAPHDALEFIGKGLASVRMVESAAQAAMVEMERDGGRKRLIRKVLYQSASQCAKIVPSATLRVSPAGPFWEKIEEVLS